MTVGFCLILAGVRDLDDLLHRCDGFLVDVLGEPLGQRLNGGAEEIDLQS